MTESAPVTNPGRVRWPVCGREREADTIASWFDDADVGGVLLTGEPGVGKSALADVVADDLSAARVVRIAGNPALAGVPYGALTHLLPDGAIGPSGEVRRADTMRALAAEAGRTLFVVDDPVDLDDGTLGLLAQMVGAGAAFLIATVRAGAPVPSPIVALERTHGIRRLAVERLDDATVAAILEVVLGGPVAPETADALATASSGNPLYLRELVDHAIDVGTLTSGDGDEWRLAGPLAASRRLSDLVADRIGRLDGDIREFAKLVALGAPIRWSVIQRAGAAAEAVELERLGVVVVHDATDPTVDIAHPMQGDVLRSDIRVLERRRLLATLIDWFESADPTVDERLRVADWQLGLGIDPDVATLEEGANRAWSVGDHHVAERFATAALEHRSSLGTAAVLVDALLHTGRADEADAVAERYLADDDGSDRRARSRLVGLRVFNNLWYREQPAIAADVVAAERRTELDDVASDELLIHEAYVELGRSNPQRVLELVERRSWTTQLAPQGLLLTAQMLADVGRTVDGLSTIERAAAALAGGGTLTVSSPGAIDAARIRLLTLAGRLDDAEALIATLSQRTEGRSDPFIRGYLFLSSGRIAILRGRPAAARKAFSEGRRIGQQQTNRVVSMGCVAGLAIAAAYLGDVEACDAVLPELESYQLARVVRPSIAAGTAWALATVGQPARARELLVAEATYSASRSERSDAASLVVEAARLGAAAEVRDLVGDLAPEVDGLALVSCQAATALASTSIDALLEAEIAAAAAGLDLLAAELATAAALELRRAEDPRAAAAARTRAAGHLAGCEGASSPGLVVTEAVSPLSAREREIAGLAASGLSNQEIAARLYLSVRTVGNHLQSSYTKLGIGGRSELVDALTTVR